MGDVGAENRRAGQRQIADGVERLVAHEFVAIAQALGVSTRSPSMATEFSSEEPSAKPAAQSFFTSATKPKVRALAISVRKVWGSISKARLCWPIVATSKSISTSTRKPASQGFSSARQRPCSTYTDLRTLRYLRRRAWVTRPTRVDGGDELGGRAVHDRRLRPVDLDEGVVDAEAGERGHQMLDVATVAPARSPITVQSAVWRMLRQFASIRRSEPSARPVRRKTMP